MIDGARVLRQMGARFDDDREWDAAVERMTAYEAAVEALREIIACEAELQRTADGGQPEWEVAVRRNEIAWDVAREALRRLQEHSS